MLSSTIAWGSEMIHLLQQGSKDFHLWRKSGNKQKTWKQELTVKLYRLCNLVTIIAIIWEKYHLAILRTTVKGLQVPLNVIFKFCDFKFPQ